MSDPDQLSERGSRAALGADLIIPVMAAAFTVYFLVDAADLVWEARANGTVIGIILLALLVVQSVRVAVQLQRGGGTPGFGDLTAFNALQLKRILLLVILVVFVAAIPWLGTTLGIFLVMTAAMGALGVREPLKLLGVAGTTAAVVYLLFIAFLQTRLPRGPIEQLLAQLFGGA